VNVQLAVEAADVTPGVLGLVVVAALVAATVFLLRSLNKQLKRVDFDETSRPDQPSGPDQSRPPDQPRGHDDRG
jgi:hypothetical protein